MKRIGAFALAWPLLLVLAGQAAAQGQGPHESARAAAQDFYRGKQLKLIVGTSSGQDYDLWARLIGRHITRHIPGQPSLIVENMPGAGHIVATNHLFNVAPRDGTAIGMVSRGMTDAAIMRVRNIRFEPSRFNWLGSPELNHRVMFVSAAAGIALINSVGNIGGFASTFVVGWMTDLTHSTSASLYLFAGLLVVAALLMLAIPARVINK